jgi:hypothetical protein
MPSCRLQDNGPNQINPVTCTPLSTSSIVGRSFCYTYESTVAAPHPTCPRDQVHEFARARSRPGRLVPSHQSTTHCVTHCLPLPSSNEASNPRQLRSLNESKQHTAGAGSHIPAMAAGGEAVQKALQSVAQSTGWTYSLLWRLCPRQGYASSRFLLD